MERNCQEAAALVGIGVLRHQLATDNFQLRGCLRQFRPGLEARYYTNGMRPAILQVGSGVLTKRSKNIPFFSVQLETWGRDANNCITLVVKYHRRIDNSRVGTEAALPQNVAQDDYRPSTGLVLFRQENSSLQKRNTQDRKKLGSNLATLDVFRHSRLSENTSRKDETGHAQG